jgi:hypothetical protein
VRELVVEISRELRHLAALRGTADPSHRGTVRHQGNGNTAFLAIAHFGDGAYLSLGANGRFAIVEHVRTSKPIGFVPQDDFATVHRPLRKDELGLVSLRKLKTFLEYKREQLRPSVEPTELKPLVVLWANEPAGQERPSFGRRLRHVVKPERP